MRNEYQSWRTHLSRVESGMTDVLVAVGADHRHVAVQVRERLAFTADDLADGLRDLHVVAREGLVISTCNRIEIYAVVPAVTTQSAVSVVETFLATSRQVSLADVASATWAKTGDEAVQHLIRVAAGLESMILGEPQILGQIRDAFTSAQSVGTVGPVLSRLVTSSLRTGKRARSATGIARNRTSIAHAAVALAATEMAHHGVAHLHHDADQTTHLGPDCPNPVARQRPLEGLRAVVVGAGKMATIAARLLRSADVGDLVIANRTVERADALATATGGRAVSLDGLSDNLAHADLAIIATGGSQPVLTPAMLPADRLTDRQRPLLLIDVGVPRCVDSALGANDSIHLRDVDDLEAVAGSIRARYAAELGRAELVVEDAVASFRTWRGGRAMAPTVAALCDHTHAIRDEELSKALSRLGHLNDRDREVVRALAVGLTNKLLHQPVSYLTQRATIRREADAAALMRLFGFGDERLPMLESQSSDESAIDAAD